MNCCHFVWAVTEAEVAVCKCVSSAGEHPLSISAQCEGGPRGKTVDSPTPKLANARPVEAKPKVRRNPKAPRQVLPVRSPEERVQGAVEVSLGFSLSKPGLRHYVACSAKIPFV